MSMSKKINLKTVTTCQVHVKGKERKKERQIDDRQMIDRKKNENKKARKKSKKSYHPFMIRLITYGGYDQPICYLH